MWNEFAGGRERLTLVAAAIREGYRAPPASVGAVPDDIEEGEFPEGRIVAESDLREAGAKLNALSDNFGDIPVTARESRHRNPGV